MAHVRLNKVEVHLTGTRLTEKVVRDVCRSVELSAKIQLSFGPYTTGNLGRSIHTTIRYRRNTVVGSVGSELDHAEMVHDGVKAHPIYPNRAEVLKFYWRRVGATVHLPRVSHPGQRGKFYLTTPLRIAAARHGMRVVIHPRGA